MNNQFFDKVIVSSDESPTFLNFWPIVSKAYQKFFGIKPTLALVSNRSNDENFINSLKEYGEVYTLPVIVGIPIQNLAKVARFIIASQMEDKVCMIEDIDTIPLQSNFIIDRLCKRNPNFILAVGHEVLAKTEHAGKFPISNITSEGYNFKKLFNPNNLGYEDLIQSFVGLKIVDHKEDINNHPSIFSDESLIRGLITKYKLSHLIQKVDRNVNIHQDWIDRSWWKIDEKKLLEGKYVCCNFLRPCKENFHNFIPIINFIYGNLSEYRFVL